MFCVIHILPQSKNQDPGFSIHFVTPWPLRAGLFALYPGQQARWGHRTDASHPPSPRRWSPFTRRAAKPALPAAAMTRSASFCFSQTAFVNRPPEAWLPQLLVLIGRKPAWTGKLKQGPSSKRRPRPRNQCGHAAWHRGGWRSLLTWNGVWLL